MMCSLPDFAATSMISENAGFYAAGLLQDTESLSMQAPAIFSEKSGVSHIPPQGVAKLQLHAESICPRYQKSGLQQLLDRTLSTDTELGQRGDLAVGEIGAKHGSSQQHA